jgi:hypothetical protein
MLTVTLNYWPAVINGLFKPFSPALLTVTLNYWPAVINGLFKPFSPALC